MTQYILHWRYDEAAGQDWFEWLYFETPLYGFETIQEDRFSPYLQVEYGEAPRFLVEDIDLLRYSSFGAQGLLWYPPEGSYEKSFLVVRDEGAIVTEVRTVDSELPLGETYTVVHSNTLETTDLEEYL